MAAYAYTHSSLMKNALKINDVVGLTLIAGRVDITNYNATTLPEITEITGAFKNIIAVVVGAVTDNGFLVRWNTSDESFRAYQGDYSEATDGPLVEAATDDDVGEFDFIVVGFR